MSIVYQLLLQAFKLPAGIGRRPVNLSNLFFLFKKHINAFAHIFFILLLLSLISAMFFNLCTSPFKNMIEDELGLL